MITGPRETLKLARKRRSEMSLPEVILWRELRQRPGGFKFRRQHAAGSFVLDFYCASVRLAIENDGHSHDSAHAQAQDERRSEWLSSQGVATLRMAAWVILSDIAGATVRIVDVCRERAEIVGCRGAVPLHQPAAGPPPRFGED